MRDRKATSVNAVRKLGDLHLTTCTYQHAIQLDYTITNCSQCTKCPPYLRFKVVPMWA